MILHLFSDEKVVDRCVNLFNEALPGRNLFVVFAKGELKYTHRADNMIIYHQGDILSQSYFDNIDSVIIHYLTAEKIDFIHDFGLRQSKIYWAVWGADMYNNILAKKGYKIFYEPLYYSIFKGSLFGYIEKKAFDILRIERPYVKQMRNFIKDDVTYLITSSEEHDIQSRYLKESKAKNILPTTFSLYYTIDDILNPSIKDSFITGNNIWIGNSASVTNNHNYAFGYLEKLNISNRNIITPLSYGGNKKYQQHVIRCGKVLGGENFVPLLDFMPLDEYNKMLIQSSVFIFGNWRQEAVGNVTVALYLGAKVFLSRKNPLLEHYIKAGYAVYCLEEIDQSSIDMPLTIEQRNNNRKLIINSMSREATINGIRQIWG